MGDPFIFEEIMVQYDAENNHYTCFDQLIGAPIGHFQCDEGPGWVFIAKGGLIMDELRSLANFQNYLQKHLANAHRQWDKRLGDDNGELRTL